MKYVQTIAFIFLLTMHTSTFAQNSKEVNEVVATLSLGDRTGYAVNLGSNSEKEVTKALKAWLAEMQKKVSIDETGKHELKVTNITLTALSENPANIYFLFSSTKDEVTVTGFFELNGAFVSTATNADKVQECETMMQKFAFRIEKIAIEEKVALSQKELEKRNDEKTVLEKTNKQLNDKIIECNETIKKAESDLEQNAKNQEAKKAEIVAQQKNLEEIQAELKKYENY